MRLEIDMGNTRTKWRCGDRKGALPAPGLPEVDCVVERVCVSSVRGDVEALRGSVRERYGVEGEFARTSARVGEVTCGYDEPAKMGVDRWLAVIAAWHASRRPCIVVGAGTALTIDVVTSAGRHVGGYIVPGMTTMRRALSVQTAAVDVPFSDETDLSPATETIGAVNRGIVLMTRDFVRSSVARFMSECENTPVVFATGGDAEVALRDLFQNGPCSDRPSTDGFGQSPDPDSLTLRLEPELVLDGLRIAFP